jgi:carbonic anhydrase
MRAAESQFDHGAPLSIWLRNIRDVYRNHQKELNAISDPEVRHRRFVDLNVIEQCMNVFRTGVVQKRRKETLMAGEPFAMPQVHAMVFDPKTGELKRLDVDFAQYEEEMSEIYGMYTLSDADKASIAAKKPAPKKEPVAEVAVAEIAE